MIGIFDSGVGGLTVVKEVKKKLPGYDLIYFGDTARVPYGNKSAELIKQYALEDAQFLLSRGAKLIIVACNTASAVALDYLRANISVPVFGVIQPALQAALEMTQNNRVGVIGTRATVNSGAFQKCLLALQGPDNSIDNRDVQKPAFMRKRSVKNHSLIKKTKLFFQAAPLLVPLIEENYLDRPETARILKHYLQPLKAEQIDTLILGCTHYPIIQSLIEKKLKQVKVINSAERVSQELKDFLGHNQSIDRSLAKRREARFFVSDLTPHLTDIAKQFLGQRINLEVVEL
jgi:glutamate racemase